MRPGFFDLDNRLQQLEALGDPLPKLNEIVDWEGFRPILMKIRQPAEAPGGRSQNATLAWPCDGFLVKVWGDYRAFRSTNTGHLDKLVLTAPLA